MVDLLANFWEEILSRQPERIRAGYLALDDEAQGTVLAHLKRMSSAPGWHPAQVESATVALRALNELSD